LIGCGLPRLPEADRIAIVDWQRCTECTDGELERVLDIGTAAVPLLTEPFDTTSAGDPLATDYAGRVRLNRLALAQTRSAIALSEMAIRGIDAAAGSLVSVRERHLFGDVLLRDDVALAVDEAIEAITRPPVDVLGGLSDATTSAVSHILSVTPFSADGLFISGAHVDWAVDDPTVAVITEISEYDATVTRTTAAGGVVSVTATAGAASATAVITFIP
jgi:hypothetical protein